MKKAKINKRIFELQSDDEIIKFVDERMDMEMSLWFYMIHLTL